MPAGFTDAVLLETILESGPVGFAFLDTDLRYVRCNRALAAMNGSDPVGYVGRSVREVVPDLADALEPALRAVLESGEERLNLEVFGAEANAGRSWLEHFYPVRDASSRVIGVGVVIEETTVRRLSAQRRESALRARLDALPHQTWIAPADGGPVSWYNRRWHEYSGLTKTDVARDGGAGMVHPDDSAPFEATVGAAILEGRNFEIEVRLRRRDGVYRWFTICGSPVIEDGAISGWVGTNTDIDGRKRSERLIEDTNLSQARALRSLTALGEAVESASDQMGLAARALEAAVEGMGGGSAAYYEFEDGLWRARLWRGDIEKDTEAVIEAGFPSDSLLFPLVLARLEPIFADNFGDDLALAEHGESLERYGVAAALPIIIGGAVRAILGVGLKTERIWSLPAREVVTAVARTLAAALERVDARAKLEAARQEADRARERTEVLAALGDALSGAPTPEAVAQATVSRLGPALSAEYALAFRVEGNSIYGVARWGVVLAEVQDTVEVMFRGVSLDSLPISRQAVMGGTASYSENYSERDDGDKADPFAQTQTATALEPVFGRDGKVGALLFAARRPSGGPWTAGERDLLRRGAATMGVALERAQATQLERDARYRALFEQVGEGFCVSEMIYNAAGEPVDYRFLEANPAFETMTGLRDAAGRTVLELIPDLEPIWIERYASLVESGQPIRFSSGVEALGRVFDVSAYPLEGLRFAVLFRNVTERTRLEARLREINEAQKRFVGDAAHELRAPLTSIRGNLDLLRRYPDMSGTDRTEAVDDALGEAGRMGRLIADLLAAARGDAADGDLFSVLRLDEVLLSAWRVARSLNERRRFDLGSLEPLYVSGDADGLKQLALSLLENAVKYTPENGEVRLELSRVDGWAEFRVADSGPGIAAEDLPHVFERFYRADKARSRNENAPGGTGLGLTIARRIAERHGGSVHLESVAGVGTTAVVRLPLEAVAIDAIEVPSV